MNHQQPRATRVGLRRTRLARAAACALLGAPFAAIAQGTDTAVAQGTTLPQVDITGTSTPPLTRITEDIAASPADVTVLGRKELDAKTVTTYGDIFRGLTGVYVNEYGQGLVAYEIKFRGFTSGHGRDVAVFLDGVPLNITGSQHTNGYADLAQLVPELVDRVEVVRGPFSVYAGNHAVAGSVQLYTDRGVPSSFKAQIDSFGRARVLPILSADAGPGTALLAVDATKGDGYTKQSDVERLNVFARYAMPLANGVAALRAQVYNAIAEAPGYIDAARIASGDISKRDALAKGIGDAKHQQNVVFNYRSDDADGRSGLSSGWIGSVYAVRDRRERFTNFDLSLPPGSVAPLGGERDRLHQAGLDVRKITSFGLGSVPAQAAVGIQYNRESIDALNFTADSERHQQPPSASMPDTVGVDRKVLTTTKAVYAQLQALPLPTVKLTVGLRFDDLDFKVRLRPPDDSYAPAVAAGIGARIESSDSRFSPKAGAAWQVLDTGGSTVDLYANYALGLKSPYAFSDFLSNVATSPSVPDLTLSTLRSYEVGALGAALDGVLRWRAGYWDTKQKKEGQRNDAGFFESFGTTERRGFDLEGSVVVARTSRLYANYSHVHARSLTSPPGQDRVPNVPEWIGTLGVQSVLAFDAHRFDLVLEDGLVGPQPVTADNASRGRRYNRLMARAAYTNASWHGVTGTITLIGYDRQLEETRFDFGGGAVGVSPRPKLQAIVGVQFPLNF